MRVLLAEDDLRLGKLIQYMLEQNDITVEWVTDGSDIYEYATYTEYDILILDWMMPGETGVFLETAHPAKFLDTVETATGRSVEIPERLRAFMQGEKRSVPMARTFEAFKDYLLSQA